MLGHAIEEIFRCPAGVLIPGETAHAVSALRIAGAQNTLMTLWSLNVGSAKDCMTESYYEPLAAPDTESRGSLEKHQAQMGAKREPCKSRSDRLGTIRYGPGGALNVSFRRKTEFFR